MKRSVGFLLGCGGLLLVGASLPAAQYEVTPLWGYRYATGVDLRGPDFNRLDMKDDNFYGLAVGFLTSDQGQMDLQWTHAKTRFAAERPGDSGPDEFDVRVDRYFLNGITLMNKGPIQRFILMGIGASHYSPTQGRSSETRLAFALGGGVKWLWSDRIGIRLDVRWAPDVVMGKSDYFCDTNGACYVTEPTQIFHGLVHLLHQAEFTSGVMTRF